MRLQTARGALIIWSIGLAALAILMPAGSWTIDDAIKSLAAQEGSGVWKSPIPYGELRSALGFQHANAVLVPPFAEPAEGGAKPGFSPYVRAWVGLETVLSHKGLIAVSTVLAIAAAWLLFSWGVTWGFLLLPLTFYGLVPWEHLLALMLSFPSMLFVFDGERRTSSRIAAGAVLLAVGTAFRLDHGVLVLLAGVALLFDRRYRELAVFAAAYTVSIAILIALPGPADFFRQSALNHHLPAWSEFGAYIASRARAVYDTLFALGSNALVSILVLSVLAVSVWALDRRRESKAALAAGWAGAMLFAAWCVRVVWGADLPVFALVTCGSLFFALPWVMLLIVSPEARKTRAMTYAIAALILGVLLMPVSSGVHWGARLLMFALPLLVIALKQADIASSRAFAAVLMICVVQTLSSAALVYGRYVETTQHTSRLLAHAGTPLVMTTRRQAIDLHSTWDRYEFFTASTSGALKSLLVEFYLMQRDSVWLHLDVTDSLLVKTFAENKPVWPHRMTVINCGNLWRQQWRLYRLVMNRSSTDWIPLLEQAAGHTMEAGDNKRALFMQEAALSLNPGRAEAHSNLALLLARLGKYAEAERAVGRALEVDSTLAPALELARQLRQRGSSSSN
ncbi:MAG: tetratricopeptide repeat protein [bacterium]|nr:tetratricopeptide repeat protein [bacterium]